MSNEVEIWNRICLMWIKSFRLHKLLSQEGCNFWCRLFNRDEMQSCIDIWGFLDAHKSIRFEKKRVQELLQRFLANSEKNLRRETISRFCCFSPDNVVDECWAKQCLKLHKRRAWNYFTLSDLKHKKRVFKETFNFLRSQSNRSSWTKH